MGGAATSNLKEADYKNVGYSTHVKSGAEINVLLPSTTTLKQKNRLLYQTIGIAAIFIGYIIGNLIAGDPKKAVLGLSSIAIAIVLIRRTEALLLALVVFTSGFFGILPQAALPHIEFPQMGKFPLADLLLVLAFFKAFFEFYFHRPIGTFSALDKAVMALYVLIALEAALTLFRGYDLKLFLSAFRLASYYALYFIMRNTIVHKKQLATLLKGLIFIAVISSLYCYVQFFLGVQLGLDKIGYMPEYGDLPRTNPSAHPVMGFVQNISLLAILMGYKGKRSKYIGVLILFVVCLGALITTFSRSGWGFFLVSVALYVLIILIIRGFSIKKVLVLVIIVTAFIWGWDKALSTYTGKRGLDILASRMQSGIDAVKYRTDTFATRMEFLNIKWNDMIEYNPVLGHGFDWGGTTSPSSYASYGRTADNGIASLLSVFGITGAILFCIIYLIIIKKSIRIMRNSSDIWVRSLAVITIVGTILSVGGSFFSDPFFDPHSIVMRMGAWAVLELLDRQTQRYTNPQSARFRPLGISNV